MGADGRIGHADLATVNRVGHATEALSEPVRSTIFARSTGALPSAIAVVRVSGPDAASACRRLTRGKLPEARRASMRLLYDPSSGDLLDQAMIIWFPGPDTATGEDLLELHLHGSIAVVAAVERTLAALPGCSPAEAGAFTRRAFENGKLDLTQVEGLADLLAAQTERQRTQALAVTRGGLRSRIDSWQEQLLAISARVEAALDHADDGDVALESSDVRPAMTALAEDMARVIAVPPAERLRDGVRVVIAGPPNAGKSSLFNALVGRQAAIVSSTPGTTRDAIEAALDMNGIPVTLIDTAGLRASTDPIEKIGVGIAEQHMLAADIILWLGASDGVPANAMSVQAKCDLTAARAHGLPVSARTGEGIGALIAALTDRAEQLLPSIAEPSLSTHSRAALEAAQRALLSGITATDEILIAEHLRAARASLDRITGGSDTEAMLDALFGKFCLGK